jgi:peptidoglycan/xylan/chitin deacetylase (PgdA/CDA1 family)
MGFADSRGLETPVPPPIPAREPTAPAQRPELETEAPVPPPGSPLIPALARQAPPRPWRPTPLLTASAALHLAAAGTLAAAPQQWRLAAAALVGDHAVLAGAGLWPSSRWLGPNLCRLPAGAVRRGEVALTFDDGPDPRVTPAVIERLERAACRASFFCIGRRAEAYPELVAELVRRGHQVENHSYSHPHAFAFYPPGALRREIHRAQQLLTRLAGDRPRFFRAPAGFRSLLLERELAAAGLHLASWTRRGFDTMSREPRQVVRRLTRRLAAGDVLLLHDGSAAQDRMGVPVVLEALPRLLDELAARGLRGVPLRPAADADGAGEIS